MHTLVEPLADVDAVEVRAPADAQDVLQPDLEDRHSHVDGGQRHEDPQELIPEGARVLRLQGVEPVAREEAEAHIERHLSEIERDEARQEDCADRSFRGANPSDERETHLAGHAGFEVAVGNLHDRADDRHE
jgi:hypothetical protein